MDDILFKIGDRVKIVKKCEYIGYSFFWHPDMDNYIGKTYIVEDIGTGFDEIIDSVIIDNYAFPIEAVINSKRIEKINRLLED